MSLLQWLEKALSKHPKQEEVNPLFNENLFATAPSDSVTMLTSSMNTRHTPAVFFITPSVELGAFFFSPPIGDYHRTSTNRRSQTAPTSIPPPLALRPNPENSSYIHRRAYWLQVSRKRANENHDRTQATSPRLAQNTTAAFFALIGRWQPDTRAHIADNSSSGSRFEL